MGPLHAFLIGWNIAQLADKTFHLRDRLTGNWPPPGTPGAVVKVRVPRAEEGSPIPLFWGRVRVQSPNLVFAGGLEAVPLSISPEEGNWADQILLAAGSGGSAGGVGFNQNYYLLTMLWHLGIPGGNKDAAVTKVSTLRKFWIGERLAWSGAVSAHNDLRTVSKPSLFGGWGQGGGVAGLLTYLPGNFTQTIPSELSNSMVTAGATASLIPAYRGQAAVALYHLSSKGFIIGENPSLEDWSFEVQAKTLLPSSLPTLNSIGDGDANPACVIYDILTNPWGRRGLAASKIDTTSFAAVGVTLQNEGHGFSLWVDATTSPRDVIRLILEQIQGVMWVDPTDGKYHLSLIRNDYNVNTLPVFDRHNVVDVADFQRGTWANVANEVKVKYTSRARNYQEAEEAEQDAALISRYGLRPTEMHYPGCTTGKLARRLAARDLRALSLPLATCRLVVNRDAFEMPPGGLFKLDMTGVPGWSTYTTTVFRIFNINEGKPGDERITLECAQDQFAFDYAPFEGFEWGTVVLPIPSAVTLRLIEEAPRWLQREAAAASLLGGVEEQHLQYLAEQPATNTLTYQGRASMDAGVSYTDDTPAGPFPRTARVSVAFDRDKEPYSTATDLWVTMQGGAVPFSVVAGDIPKGRGLIYVCPVNAAGLPVAGQGELMAYESAVLDTGQYRLKNVWRGLLDTVARAHVVGEVVFFLHINCVASYGLYRFGGNWHDLGEVIMSRIRAIGGFGTADPSAVAYRASNTIKLRHLLPYPPADLKVETVKTPITIETEGVDLTWKRRDRYKTTITRGDAASEVPEDGTTYVVRATKAVTGSPGTNAATDLVTGLVAQDASTDVVLAKAGYGPLDVSVTARRPHTTDAGADVTLASWQEPAVRVNAREFRQLLLNGQFTNASPLTYWTPVNAAAYDDTVGHVFIGQSAQGTYSVFQTVDVRGFLPNRLLALATFLFKNFNADVDDTVAVKIIQLDTADAVLVTTTNTVAGSTTQIQRDKVSVTLDPACAKIKLMAEGVAVGADNGDADCRVADLLLRIGQISSALGLNMDFEAGAFTNWTNVDDSFVADTTAPLHTGTRYARPGDFVSSEISQDVTPTAGYEVGAYAVLRGWRANHNADGDRGNMVLAARDASAEVGSTETGMEAISPTGKWVTRQLVLDLPATTTTLRMRLQGDRVAGTPCDTAFDELELRIHKKLDPSLVKEYVYDTPVEQPIPTDRNLWALKFPSVSLPTYGWWTGSSWQGLLGSEADLEEENAATPMLVDAPAIGAWDKDNQTMVRTALECTTRTSAIRTETNTDYANFATSQSFTARVVFKTGEQAPTVAQGLVGRQDGTFDGAGVGWRLYLNASGQAVAKLVGANMAKTVTDTVQSICDRSLTYAALVYDQAAAELRLITPNGVQTISTTAPAPGMGEIAIGGKNFTIGDDLLGQLLSVELWSSAITTANIQAMWKHGSNPATGGTQTHGRDRPAATVVQDSGAGGFGVRVATYDHNQWPMAWSSALSADGGTGFGLAMGLAITNQVPVNADADSTKWTPGATAAWTFRDVAGVEGLKDGKKLVGDNTDTKAVDLTGITIGAGATQRIVFFARGTTAVTARVRLLNTADVVKQSFDISIKAEWQRFSLLVTAWDNSTADAKLRFFASSSASSQTLYLSGPYFLGETDEDPALLPTPGGAVVASDVAIADSFGAAQLLGNEGEIEWTGVFLSATPPTAGVPEILELKNNASNNNKRVLKITATGQPRHTHFDNAAASVDATGTAITTWNAVKTIRGRWCRAGLLDAAAAFSSVVTGSTLAAANVAVGRAVVWTHDATVAMQTLTIRAFSGLARSARVYTRESRLPHS